MTAIQIIWATHKNGHPGTAASAPRANLRLGRQSRSVALRQARHGSQPCVVHMGGLGWLGRHSSAYSSSRCYGISLFLNKELTKTVPRPDMEHSNVLGTGKGVLEDAIKALRACTGFRQGVVCCWRAVVGL